jgi:hypothetical protein
MGEVDALVASGREPFNLVRAKFGVICCLGATVWKLFFGPLDAVQKRAHG